MKYDENAICTLVSNNFLAEGINCHKYLKIDNPKIRHFLFTIGEINIENIKNLKKHKNLFHISIESFISLGSTFIEFIHRARGNNKKGFTTLLGMFYIISVIRLAN